MSPGRRRKRRFLATAALLGVVALAWGLCPSTSQAPPPQGITVLLDGAPKGLDPRFATSDFSVKLSRLLFSSLVTIDNQNGEPELDLAQSLEHPDPLTYTFTLKEATWHDGQPVTSQDVRFTFMELGRESIASPYAGLGRRIAEFQIHGPRRFTLRLKEPHAPFLANLTLGIVPSHAVDERGLLDEAHLIGSGPYRLGQRQGDRWISLEPYAGYYGGEPRSGRLIFRTIPDDNTRLLTMMGGTGHMIQNATAPLLLPVLKEDPDLVVETAPSFKYTYLAFNMEHPTLKDRRVRQAIALGIDREEIIKYKFQGSATLATGLLSPRHWAYHGQVHTWGHDPQRAKALLDQAGYPDPDGDGPEMRFWITYKTTTNKFRRAIAELMASQLARVGIGVKVQAFEWGTFFGDIKSRNFELCSLQWPSVTEPDLYAWIFHSRAIPSAENRSAGANRGAYRNQEVDALLDEGRAEPDRDKRRAIYARVQEVLAWDLPYISLWHEDNLLVRQRRLQGYRMVPNARLRHLTDAHLVE